LLLGFGVELLLGDKVGEVDVGVLREALLLCRQKVLDLVQLIHTSLVPRIPDIVEGGVVVVHFGPHPLNLLHVNALHSDFFLRKVHPSILIRSVDRFLLECAFVAGRVPLVEVGGVAPNHLAHLGNIIHGLVEVVDLAVELEVFFAGRGLLDEAPLHQHLALRRQLLLHQLRVLLLQLQCLFKFWVIEDHMLHVGSGLIVQVQGARESFLPRALLLQGIYDDLGGLDGLPHLVKDCPLVGAWHEGPVCSEDLLVLVPLPFDHFLPLEELLSLSK